jgi:phospholipid/cholesterol/gamma-HCH transport system substrate-binding protein
MKLSKEVKVGLFAFVGVVVFVLGFNFMLGFDFLKSYSRYYVVYGNSGGLVQSAEVKINGFKIGQVEEVELLHEGDASKILVVMAVDGSIVLPEGTVAEISSSDLLGPKSINIKLGKGPGVMQSKDTLIGSMEEGLAESINNMVSPLKEKSEQVLAALDGVLRSMNVIFDSSGTRKLSNGVNDLTATLSHVKNITGRLDDLTANQEKNLNDMFAHAESILRNLRNNNQAISAALGNIKDITDSLAASNLKSTVNNLNSALGEMNEMIDKINKGEGSFGELANNKELYTNLNNSSRELSLLLADMQKYPGRYFNISVFGNSKRANKTEKKRDADMKNK